MPKTTRDPVWSNAMLLTATTTELTRIPAQVGDPIVRRDGPARLVAVNENWVTGQLHALAQSQHVLVEDGGQLRISYWYFANLTDYPDS